MANDGIHPHLVVNRDRVPEGLPRQVIRDHCYRVFMMGMNDGEFQGMDAGLLDNLALTMEQAVIERDRVDVYFATHVTERVGPVFGVILDITNGLYWVDDGQRFGLYLASSWLNKEWDELAARCRWYTGYSIHPEDFAQRTQKALRQKVLTTLGARETVKPPRLWYERPQKPPAWLEVTTES